MNNLTDQSVQLVLAHVDKLAAKLGVGAEEIFNWYVKQIWIEFYVQIVWLLIVSVVIGIFIVVGRAFSKDEKEEYAKMDNIKKKRADKRIPLSALLFSIAAVFGFIELIIFVVTLIDSVPALLNTNYHAFNDLVGRLAIAL